MTGRSYLLRGEIVTVATGFNARTKDLPQAPPWLVWAKPPRGPVRNVAVRYSDGTTVVRPFRGLKKTTTEGSR